MNEETQEIMADSYFEKYMDGKFNAVHLELGFIGEKTNDVTNQVKELKETIAGMKLVEGKHYLTCPNTKVISRYEMMEKYWKVFLIAAFVLFLGWMSALYTGIQKYNELSSALRSKTEVNKSMDVHKKDVKEMQR